MILFLTALLLITRFYALFNSGAFFYNCEGLYRGWMAKEILEGAGLWHTFNFPYLPIEGGSVVISYINALFFLICGDSFFTLKLVSILISALTLCVFYWFLKRFFNIYAAVIFCLLFIFSPQEYLMASLFTIGFHAEASLLTLVIIFCFFEIFFRKNNRQFYIEGHFNRKTAALFALLGAFSGFAVYFDYICLVALLTMFALWLWQDIKLFSNKYFLIFSGGFLLGLSPWLVYNLTHGFSGLFIQGHQPAEIFLRKNPAQIFTALRFICGQQLQEVLKHGLYQIVVFFIPDLIVFIP
jgi:4-amino-4-deoxy-L-arabinose transferase-like glycosyltransferase